ncbi:IS66 family transposase [Micromonosporaceae bacterium Da 78-11]
MTRPSDEVLAALVMSLREELVAAHAVSARVSEELEQAVQRIAELEARLASNSQNSSKPPSSDGLGKPAPKTRSLRGKTPRKPGGQPGHEGRTLSQVADPKHTKIHEPGACGCGRSLTGRPVTSVTRRQCFDLPPVLVEVTEHQLVERECACGTRTRAVAPAGVDAAVQYGPRITAIVIYLYVGQFLSKQRTAQALADLFGTPMSAGTIAGMLTRATAGLDGFLDEIRRRLTGADVVGFDETGFRVAGKLHWVHCARTDRYTLVVCDAKRGREGMAALGVIDGLRGVAVHDAWAPYDTYPDVEHQLCCAHVQRELQAVCDIAPEGVWCWARQAADALGRIQVLVSDAVASNAESLEQTALAEQVCALRSAALIGVQETSARSGKLMKKHNALAKRLIARQDDYLHFTTDWRIPADNNGSERDIRMIKLRQKVSGCQRTLLGAQQFCAIRSYLSTARKHGMNFFDALVLLAEGHAWMPSAT